MQAYRPDLKPLSRALRADMTDAEQALWQRLRRKQLHGLTFNRQKPIGAYIADFYCAAARLVIELDGSQHYSAEGQASDQARTAALAKLGLRVLRFSNRDVLLEMDGVLAVIERTVLSTLRKKEE